VHSNVKHVIVIGQIADHMRRQSKTGYKTVITGLKRNAEIVQSS